MNYGTQCTITLEKFFRLENQRNVNQKVEKNKHFRFYIVILQNLVLVQWTFWSKKFVSCSQESCWSRFNALSLIIRITGCTKLYFLKDGNCFVVRLCFSNLKILYNYCKGNYLELYIYIYISMKYKIIGKFKQP